MVIKFCLVMALFAVVCSVQSATMEARQCSSSVVEVIPDADVYIGVLASIHEQSPDGDKCGKIISQSMPAFEAMRWIVDMVNLKTVQHAYYNDSYVPGVKIGLRVIDTCSSESRALSGAVELLPRAGRDAQSCSTPSASEPLMLGLIDMNTDEIAMALARFGEQYKVPVTSLKATGASLSNGNQFPWFTRTVQRDGDLQAKIMLRALDQLTWNYVVFLHTDDRRSLEYMVYIRKYAKEFNICVIDSIRLSSDASSSEIDHALNRLLSASSKAAVFIGKSPVAQDLIQRAELMLPTRPVLGDIQWAFTDSIGAMQQFGSLTYQRGMLLLLHKNRDTSEFEHYWKDIDERLVRPENPWFREWFMAENQCRFPGVGDPTLPECVIPGGTEKTALYTQDSFVEPAIDAIMVYTVALERAHEKRCGNVRGVCASLAQLSSEEFYNGYLRNTSMVYGVKQRVSTFLTQQADFRQEKTTQLDENGDTTNTGVDFLNYRESTIPGLYKFHKISTFPDGISSDPIDTRRFKVFDRTRTIAQDHSESRCPTSGCGTCLASSFQPDLVYSSGDVILGGVFSVHRVGQDDFSCGSINTMAGAQALEAMIFAIKQLNSISLPGFLNGTKLGLLAVDDCSSSLIAENIVNGVYSGMIPVLDDDGTFLDIRTIDGFLSSSTSSLTVDFSYIVNHLIRKPHLGYAATTTELNNEDRFPWYVGAIQSQKYAMIALLKLAKEYDWRYIQVVYSSSQMVDVDELKRLAAHEGVCVVAAHEFDADKTMDRLRLRRNVQPVMLLLNNVREFLIHARDEGAVGEFTFLVPGGFTSLPSHVIAGLQNIANNTIVVNARIQELRSPFSSLNEPSFINYLASLDPSTYNENPWFSEWYQSLNNCSVDGILRITNCVPGTRINIRDFDVSAYSNYVIRAVLAFAQGLTATLQQYCGSGYTSPCANYLTSADRNTVLLRKIEEAMEMYVPDIIDVYSILNGSYERIKTYDFSANSVNPVTTLHTSLVGRPDLRSTCSLPCLDCMYMFKLQKYMYIHGDIIIPAIVDVHYEGNSLFSCSDMRVENGFQTTEAIAFALDRVNSGIDGIHTGGIKFGAIVFDGCADAERILNIISSHVGSTGLGIPEITGKTFPGWMTYQDEGTIKAATLLREFRVPLISPGARTPELDDKVKYSTLFRTVISDTKILEAIAQVLKQLDFTYVTVVNAPNAAGQADRERFKKIAPQYGICINEMFEFETDSEYDRLLYSLVDGDVDVILIFSDPYPYVERFLTAVSNAPNGSRLVEKLFFIANRQWTELLNANTTYKQYVQGMIMVDMDVPSNSDLFNNHLRSLHPTNYRRNPWFNEYYNKVGGYLRTETGVVPTIDAVYAYAQATVKTIRQICTSTDVICPAFKATQNLTEMVIQNLDKTSVTDNNLFGNTAEPFIFQERESNRGIAIKQLVITQIVNIREETIRQANADEVVVVSVLSDRSTDPLIRSTCQGECIKCERSGTSDEFTYTNGDLIIAGLFDVHKQGSTPYTCGTINTKYGFELLEAFHYAIDYVNSRSGIFRNVLPGLTLGGLAFDVCQQPSRAGNIVANIHSGNRELIADNVRMDPDRINVYVGPFDTESSIRVADALDVLGMPQISYGATSLELQDQLKYRYFKRSVPADDKQSRAIISFLKYTGIEYVQVIYSFDSVGLKGRDEFNRLAALNRICVAQSISVGMTGDPIESDAQSAVAKLLNKRSARTVILFLSKPYHVMLAAENNVRVAASFLLIGTDKWGFDASLLRNLNTVLQKAVTFDIETADLPGFDRYLEDKMPLTHPDHTTNPWFREYYELLYDCSLTDKTRPCSTDMGGISRAVISRAVRKYSQDPYVLYVINAVFAAAMGIDSAIKKACPPTGVNNRPPRLCVAREFMRSGERRQLILDGITDVNFKDATQQPFYFTPSGESDRGFHIYQVVQNKYKDIGSYNDTHRLKLDATYELPWNSSCSEQGSCTECSFPDYKPSRYMLKPSTDDLNVIGIFDVHRREGNSFQCGPMDVVKGFQNMMAFFYAIDLINKDPKVRSSMRLGGLALDTCSISARLGQDLYSLLSGSGVCEASQLSGQLIPPDTVVAYLTLGNENAIISSEILSPRQITSISPSATSMALNDRSTHNFFLRTVPPDDKQAEAILAVTRRFGFNYAAVVYSTDAYGRNAARVLLENSKNSGQSCFGSVFPMSSDSSLDYAKQIIRRMREVVGMRAVVLVLYPEQIRLLLRAANELQVRQRFVWIGSNTWGGDEAVVRDLEDVASGAITVQIRSELVEKFNEHLRSFDMNNPPAEIPLDWFDDYYQTTYKCRKISSIVQKSYPRTCDGTENKGSVNQFVQDVDVFHTILATFVIGYGLDSIQGCQQQDLSLANCLNLRSNRRRLIYDSLSSMQWSALEGILNNKTVSFSFTDEGYGNIDYNILNYHRDGHGGYAYGKLGSWRGELTLDTDSYRGFYFGTAERVPFPPSRCPVGGQCRCANPDIIAAFRRGDVDVESTAPYPSAYTWEFINTTISSSMAYSDDGGQTYVSVSGERVSAQSAPKLADRYIDAWGIIVVTLAGLGLLFTCCVFIYLLVMYPVRSGTTILGYMVILGLILMFTMVFPFVLHANQAVCGIRRFGLGLAYCVCFSALFLKLVDNWHSRKKNPDAGVTYAKLGAPKGLFFIGCAMVAIQILIAAQWLILQPPTTSLVVYERELWSMCTPLVRDGFTLAYDKGLILSCLYCMILILLCIILGFSTWNTNKNHREARYILGVALLSVPCWVAWCVVAGLAEYKFRDAAVAIGLLFNAYIIMACVPIRKFYLFNRYHKIDRAEEREEKEIRKRERSNASMKGSVIYSHPSNSHYGGHDDSTLMRHNNYSGSQVGGVNPYRGPSSVRGGML